MTPQLDQRFNGFQRRVRQVVGLPLLLALILAVLLFFQHSQFRRISRGVAEADSAISDITTAERMLAEAQSGVRGFILTRDESYLEPYHRTVKEMPALFQSIESRLSSPEAKDRLDQAKLVTAEWIEYSRWPIRLAAEGKTPSKVIPRGTGKRIGERLTEKMSALLEGEKEFRNSRLSSASRSANATLFGALAVLVGFGLYIAFRSRRLVLSLSSDYEAANAELQAKADQLFESREWFSTTLLSIGDGVIVVDPEERVEFLNPVAERLTGWRMADAKGRMMREVFEIIDEQTREPAFNPAKKVLNEGTMVGVSNHTLLLGKDGREYPIEDSASPIRGRDGKTLGVVLVFRDTSEKHFAASLLAETEKRFQALANSAPVLIWTAGRDKIFDWFNEGWLQFRGRTMQQEIGSGWLEGVHPEDLDRMLKTYVNAFESRKPFEVHYRFLRANGEYRDILNRGSPRLGANGKFMGYIGSCTDITDGEAVRKKLEAITVDLEKAVRSRDEFLSIASHELKTPLTSLKLQLQMTQRGIRVDEGKMPSPEKLKQVIDLCLEQSTRITNLIEELLDVSRIQEGKLNYTFERVDLEKLVRDEVTHHAEQFRIAGNEVSTHTIPVFVEADRFRLEQVLVNLLTNAMKYGSRKPVKVSVFESGEFACLSVQDQGAGIPKELHESIFNRFERGDQARNISGLGLGLYIAKQIVKAHGGAIEIDSEVNKGSTFTVPVTEGPDGRGGAVMSANKLILVIEDDVAIRETFAEILDLEGYQVVQAEHGQDAIEKLESGLLPCLILLDLMMPIMDGFAFRSRQMQHGEWAKIPVLVLSADVRMKEKLDLFQGAAYLRKPPDIDVLIAAVAKYCASS